MDRGAWTDGVRLAKLWVTVRAKWEDAGLDAV